MTCVGEAEEAGVAAAEGKQRRGAKQRGGLGGDMGCLRPDHAVLQAAEAILSRWARERVVKRRPRT